VLKSKSNEFARQKLQSIWPNGEKLVKPGTRQATFKGLLGQIIIIAF
jgi:hypothetical protein